MSDHVTDAVIQSCAELHSDLHLLPNGHPGSKRAHRMSRGLEPSYEFTYQEVHKADFEQLSNLV